jgi:PHS family inorganic phosphate transporter-like MFS transporter
MPETPRFTAVTLQDVERTKVEMAQYVGQVQDGVQTEDEDNAIVRQPRIARAEREYNLTQFLSKYGVHLFACAASWFLLDIAFYSQNLFQKDVFQQIGWVNPSKYYDVWGETAAIAKAQAIIALGSTIPGYWFTVFFVDTLGRKFIQIMGFVFMTAFMAAMAGAYKQLLNPNSNLDNHPTGYNKNQPNQRNGWVAMYAFCFFFANFGPNATTFVVPAELFPTKWKTTAHGFCAASGKAGAIIGGFGFLYAAQPRKGEVIPAYPCDQNYLKGTDYACKIQANCPAGRAQSDKSHINNPCDICTPGILAGCYPFGIGIQGALGFMAGINFLGLLVSFLIPETAGKTLEELNGDDDPMLNEKDQLAKNGTAQEATNV